MRVAGFLTGKSIYGQITSKANRKGWLPDSFLLPGDSRVPGEADGILLYHSNMKEIDPEGFEEFICLLAAACEQPKLRKKNEKELAVFLGEHHTLTLIDRLCDEVFNGERGIDLIDLADAAYGMAINSNDVNIVKLGLSLMGILNVEDREDCRRAIVSLGKYEEFTFYSIFAVSEWHGANTIVLDYAKNLKGWGKNHAELWLEQL